MKRYRPLMIIKGINDILNNRAFKETYRKSDKDFTRERKLLFMHYFHIILNFMTKSLQVELDNYFDVTGLMGFVSKQAFSKGRQKIKWEAFQHIFDSAVGIIFQEEEPLDRYKGYRITAIDGTEAYVPPTASTLAEFGQKERRDNCKAKISIHCDVLGGTVLDAGIGRYDKGERLFAREHLEKYSQYKSSKELVIMDRGYPSAELVDFLEKSGYKYLMRVRSKFNLAIDRSDKSDFYIDLPYEGRTYKVRVIKLVLPTGEIETLITNLARNQFKQKEFMELYFMRWPVETKYDTIKNKLELEAFSGKTATAVKQDFYATMFLANLVAVTKAEADDLIEKQDAVSGNKLKYQANEKVLIGKMKNRLILCLMLDDDGERAAYLERIVLEMTRHKSAIRPGRSFERKKRAKSSIKNYNKRAL